jgi:glycosyltransferase involved in cell wall biosynthesis
MRVLIVHNRYRSANPSGENRAVERDVVALEQAGVDVRRYVRESDEISDFGLAQKAALAIRPMRSGSDRRQIAAILDEWRPDVVHFHNLYPLISPAFIAEARRRHVPLVQTVHNYRHVCVNGLYARDGSPCHECAGRRIPLPAVQHGCYRDSRLQSVTMAAALARHRSTWRQVDRFVAVSRPMADFLINDVGVDPERVVVRPNSVPDPGPVHAPGHGMLYVGRLEGIKGVPLLLEAWERAAPPGWHLTIAGDGPERPLVERTARLRTDVEYLGTVDPACVQDLMDRTRVVVVPSLAYEAMPMVVVEAFSRGRPVLGTSHGALADLIHPAVGWLCEPTVEALAEAIACAAAEPVLDPVAPRRIFDASYRGDHAVEWLLDQYRSLTGEGGPRPAPKWFPPPERDIRHSPRPAAR